MSVWRKFQGRLRSLNKGADQIILRLRGPRPESTGENAKNPATPSVRQILEEISSEIGELEIASQQIGSFIG